jgi:hypothetical protein
MVPELWAAAAKGAFLQARFSGFGTALASAGSLRSVAFSASSATMRCSRLRLSIGLAAFVSAEALAAAAFFSRLRLCLRRFAPWVTALDELAAALPCLQAPILFNPVFIDHHAVRSERDTCRLSVPNAQPGYPGCVAGGTWNARGASTSLKPKFF